MFSRFSRKRTLPLLLTGALLLAAAAPTAAQQVPDDVRVLSTNGYDPLYHGEHARRAFFDGYAITADFFYSALEGFSALPSLSEALKFGFHLDYALAPSFDLSAVFNATGGISGNAMRLNWVALKYYWYDDGTDYALRLAVDPALDSGLGFRQTDIALLTSTFTSPTTGLDFGLGLRRLQLAYRQWLPEQLYGAAPDDTTFDNSRILESHVFGQEVHGTATYKWLFDPAESHLFFSLIGEAGGYRVLETESRNTAAPASSTKEIPTEIGGGVLWVRIGMQWNRPSFQITPSLSVPFLAWGRASDEEDETALLDPAYPRFGFRLTIR